MSEYENQKYLTPEEYNNYLVEKQMSIEHFNITGEHLKFEIYNPEFKGIKDD